MSSQPIFEFDAKAILRANIDGAHAQAFPASVAFETEIRMEAHDSPEIIAGKIAQIESAIECLFEEVCRVNPKTTSETKFVVKIDQLIKRRGISQMLACNLPWMQIKAWIAERAGRQVSIGEHVGVIKRFIIEPFYAHSTAEEYYLCLRSTRTGEQILFYHEGGIHVGDTESISTKMHVPIGEEKTISEHQLKDLFLAVADDSVFTKQKALQAFTRALLDVFVRLNLTFVEINPIVVHGDGTVVCLDVAARLDFTAEHESGALWGNMQRFPVAFGRDLLPEEKFVRELDAKTGASLKLTVLDVSAPIWLLVAGGGASLVYADAIAAAGCAAHLANYGEYSGAPNEAQTFEYANALLDLMCRQSSSVSCAKALIIGGSIANFTNVAVTFKGIARAIIQHKTAIREMHTKIFVRRGGPNCEEGLGLMRNLATDHDIDIRVYGPETHITAIVPMALRELKPVPIEGAAESEKICSEHSSASPIHHHTLTLNSDFVLMTRAKELTMKQDQFYESSKISTPKTKLVLNSESQCFIFGLQIKAAQSMLDFDYLCQRKRPSVAAIIYSFGSGPSQQKLYWGSSEITVPVYSSVSEAASCHPSVDVAINFASCRSVLNSCRDLMANSSVKMIVVVAEGVTERHTRLLIAEAVAKNVLIVGPATVGGIRAGAFKMGNASGMTDNVLFSKLYRPGCVSYVAKSGGLSNELNSIICQTTNGVCEGIAIGGDRYPTSSFMDHIMRFEEDPACRIIVVLGEVGGLEEYKVSEALTHKIIRKPILAWCIGICASFLKHNVQFGHAGACANSNQETAAKKNEALGRAGAFVPSSFEELPAMLKSLYIRMLADGSIEPLQEPSNIPKVPIDYEWAKEMGLVRKTQHITSTICDERGSELLYAGVPISRIINENLGIGGVISLLWFKRRLPEQLTKFIEMALILTADHGPAVSGAFNTIVTTRAGKDLVSSVASGLLTIGDRFGGALDGAAIQFSEAFDQEMSAEEFVRSMRQKNTLIQGIGHKVKSIHNPDNRTQIIKEYVLKNFEQCPIFRFALEVEKVTTKKRDNLILNVDGAIAASFVDLMRFSGEFNKEEAEMYIKIGSLNGLFVLGRTIGFIGHHLDQRRLNQGLYRHPWEDITYSTVSSN